MLLCWKSNKVNICREAQICPGSLWICKSQNSISFKAYPGLEQCTAWEAGNEGSSWLCQFPAELRSSYLGWLKPFQLDSETRLNSLSPGTERHWAGPDNFRLPLPTSLEPFTATSAAAALSADLSAEQRGLRGFSDCLDPLFTEVCWWAGKKQRGKGKENLEQS